MNPLAVPALLFPGQGTESVGMSAGWEGVDAWIETLDRAEAHSGCPLRQWMREGPEALLRAPRNAPFAVIAHSVGIYRAHRAAGMPLPAFATGHSLGYFSALVAAEGVPIEAVMDLVNAVEDLCIPRFQGEGGMAFFIGITELELRQALINRPGQVLSNLNGKSQFTVSGSRKQLEALVEELGPQCLKAGLLPVRHPLHGPHMVPLLPEITRRLSAWKPQAPKFPVISHTDGRWITDGAEAWDECIASVGLPVCWLEVVQAFGSAPVALYECGFGNQLANLTRWAARERTIGSLQNPELRTLWQ